MTNPMEAINNIIGNAAAPTTTARWLVCDNCKGITEHDMSRLPPATCSKCLQVTAFKVMPSMDAATRLASAAPVAPVAPAPVAEAAPVVKRQRKTAPAPVVAEPIPAQVAEGVKDLNAAVSTHLNHTEPEVLLNEQGQVDFKAMREAATNHLIQKFCLNEVDIKEVGQGTIFSLGFTRWVINENGNRAPSYNFMEMTDTPASFKEELNAARAEEGMVTIDVAKVVGLNAEVAATSFGGELIASLKNQTGPVRAGLGSRIRLGAKLSKTGRIVWFALGVVK